MARNATILKVSLQIADMDRHFYDTLGLTVAQHPSETDERVMVRILAFALNAHAALQFTRGLSSDNEPDIWRKNLRDEIDLWIDVGQPEENRIRKACQRADEVCIYCYGGQNVELWWRQVADKVSRHQNLSIIDLAQHSSRALAPMVRRQMDLQCNIDDGDICISDADTSVYIEHRQLYGNSRHQGS